MGVDQLTKEILDHDIDPLASVHCADLKPLINSFIQQIQTKWHVVVQGRDLYLLKPTLGPPTKFQHLTRAEKVVITRLRIGHTKATKAHILSREPPTTCHLVVRHWPLTICSWGVQYYRKVVTNTSRDLHNAIPARSVIWYEQSKLYSSLNWCNFL